MAALVSRWIDGVERRVYKLERLAEEGRSAPARALTPSQLDEIARRVVYECWKRGLLSLR